MNNCQRTLQRLSLSRIINFFGSSFSDFVLPLFIYETTKSPLLMAIQWTIGALSKLLAGKLSGTFHIGKTNKSAILTLDIVQGIGALIPLLFWNFNPSLGTMIAGFIISFSNTLQTGYLESLIYNITEQEDEKVLLRTTFNSNLDRSKNLGLFLGYLIAWISSTYIGYKFAILVDSITFIFSSLIVFTIKDDHFHKTKTFIKESFSLLFQNKQIASLTLSQALLSFSIFIFNSSFIFVMKSAFNAPNSMVAALFIFQSFLYIIGSSLSAKFKHLSLKIHKNLRYLYFIIFLLFAFSNSSIQFIVLNGLLSLLISFTQPTIITLFQSFSNSENSRSMGSARASTMAVTGSIGSALCGLILTNFSFRHAFVLASITSLICGVLFNYLINQKEFSKS